MGPEVAAAASSAGGDLLGSTVSALFNMGQQRKAQEHALNVNTEQWNRQLEMWNKTNEYNSPQAQRDRLEAAGISPWSMYGQMSTGQANNITPPATQTIAPYYISDKVDLGAAISQYFAVKKFHSDQKLVEKGLEGQQLKNDYQWLVNDQLQWYNKTLRDAEGAAKIAGWKENAEQYQRNKEIHGWSKLSQEEKVKEYVRQAERYADEQDKMKYDKQARNYSLEEWKKKLEMMEQDIGLYGYRKERMEWENARGWQNVKLGKNEVWFDDERRYLYENYGFDNKNDGIWSKILGRTERSVEEALKEQWKKTKGNTKKAGQKVIKAGKKFGEEGYKFMTSTPNELMGR